MFASEAGGILFLQFFVLGIFFGLAYEIVKIFKIAFSNNIFIQNAIKFVYFLGVGFAFCIFLLSKTNGIVYFYCVVATVVAAILEQISVGFFFTKFYQLLYNVFTKLWTKSKNTKIFKRITK